MVGRERESGMSGRGDEGVFGGGRGDTCNKINEISPHTRWISQATPHPSMKTNGSINPSTNSTGVLWPLSAIFQCTHTNLLDVVVGLTESSKVVSRLHPPYPSICHSGFLGRNNGIQ